MKTLIINIDNNSTLKLLSDLTKKLGLNPKVLSDKKKDDIALIRAIDEAMVGEKLPVRTSYTILDKLLH